jgi:hypothetical protein
MFSFRHHRINPGSVIWIVLVILPCLSPFSVSAQERQSPDSDAVPTLEMNVGLNNYFFKNDYIFNPVVTADRGGLHLEGRYNYEDLNTLSLFAGYNISVGQALRWEVTPMFGFAFGHTSGIIPAVESTLSYGAFEWYIETEYMIITDDGDENYLFTWSELNYYPWDWLSVGIIGTRTRLYETDLEVPRGFSLGYYHGPFAVMGSLMNAGFGDPYFYLSASFVFD